MDIIVWTFLGWVNNQFVIHGTIWTHQSILKENWNMLIIRQQSVLNKRTFNLMKLFPSEESNMRKMGIHCLRKNIIETCFSRIRKKYLGDFRKMYEEKELVSNTYRASTWWKKKKKKHVEILFKKALPFWHIIFSTYLNVSIRYCFLDPSWTLIFSRWTLHSQTI